MTARTDPSVLHLDLDAFFAAVEQRDKPSLRGRPVIVGGLGPRGVVSTASYEARDFGVRSAMPMSEARSRCPNAAFLAGRFGAYRAVSRTVMEQLHTLSPLVEPLSLDEAFVDLAAGEHDDLSATAVRGIGERLRSNIHAATSVTASVGAATSKTLAKIASEKAKPDGLVVIEPGTELDVLHPMSVRVLPGVGPATADRVARLGIKTVGDLATMSEHELVDLLGEAHGRSLSRLARGYDDRPVSSERASKSISVEDTFDHDITEPALLTALVNRMASKVAERLAASGHSGRTVTLKARLHDFTTLSRSVTLPGPTDAAREISRLAVQLLDEIDTSSGIRLLGVGVSGLSDWVQHDLLSSVDTDDAGRSDDVSGNGEAGEREPGEHVAGERRPGVGEPGVGGSGERGARERDIDIDAALHRQHPWVPGMDVVHTQYGPGWVWGSGLGRVTVRFETADTPPGPVRTFAADDPDLAAPDNSTTSE
ncbi:DNA polymerase IV [Actinobacteria bacterium YIM 96077]|uniref:DNA polymerase IV n=1 Tax=Phytoactinopolyspora halophila TaxID=1981511 RepID=A0A329QJM7_9ACTN|nr:DNA polymerase IV [Phytoactinopolyspora halophila]AYY13519.1 DNA polymerase IV [Actinobacteria bacterium YIM 96077]RAW12426.1 DNA polymerase IV [Phytoactinopolyspora halophila]